MDSVAVTDGATDSIHGHGAAVTDPATDLIDSKKEDSDNAALRKELLVDEDEFFDPPYDFNFTNIIDEKKYKRGGEAYKRPCGWIRIAIQVLNKYPEGNAWLGPSRGHGGGRRSVAGEWPVSYHGTSADGAKGIIQGHYKAGPGCSYGRGIYSTPDLSVAEQYCKKFHSKKLNADFQVILQNRINPDYRQVENEGRFCLVPVPPEASEEEEKEIVERAIRPYGLLLKRCSRGRVKK